MSVEQYAEEIVVVAVGKEPAGFKIWLREETSGDLVSDLQWLCEEYPDYHIVVDLANLDSFDSASYKAMLDLQKWAEGDDFRFVLCGLSDHLKWQLKCVHLADEFDMFDTREAAIADLLPEGVEP